MRKFINLVKRDFQLRWEDLKDHWRTYILFAIVIYGVSMLTNLDPIIILAIVLYAIISILLIVWAIFMLIHWRKNKK